jgi:outer membrane receptor protein involved in Fe transport
MAWPSVRKTPIFAIAAGIALSALQATGQSPELLPALTVLAGRQLGTSASPPLAEWTQQQLRLTDPRTIDELLAREPSFSLYRRQSSLFGNPTSAGVSLRNSGATAASRTLVLLDGIPQNDPFGGWVYWARHDPAALDSIRIVTSARAALWGNQSPAGVIQMTARTPFEDRGHFKIGGGSQGTIRGSTAYQASNPEKTRSVSFSAFGLHTDGFHALSPSQRGPVDTRLETDFHGGEIKFAFLAAPDLTVEPSVSHYHEERNNGTQLTGNSTDAVDLALRVTSVDGDFSWQALAWHQQREFQSVFSSVNAARTAETIALDQFDVPSQGTGGAFTLRWDNAGTWEFASGVDARFLSGETNEKVATFRIREAGGDQALAGIFAAAGYRPNELTRIDANVRLDHWSLSEGRRIETSQASGNLLRSDRPGDRDDFEPSAALEFTREIHNGLDAHLSTGTTFRLPTLNELHRPFRVRNDIVEANPDLDPERFHTIDGGLRWVPTETFKAEASVFHFWIKDAIANVPITDATAISDIFGTIPPGGSGSQRQNVDQAQVTGIEANLEWKPEDSVTLGLAGLWSKTRFKESPEQPLLEGKPFPQAPELRLTAGSHYQATSQVGLFADIEYGSSQFDDALATRSIPDYTSVRIGATWQVAGAIYQIRIENLFDEEIQTGLTSDGLRTLAAPRSLWLGAEWEF